MRAQDCLANPYLHSVDSMLQSLTVVLAMLVQVQYICLSSIICANNSPHLLLFRRPQMLQPRHPLPCLSSTMRLPNSLACTGRSSQGCVLLSLLQLNGRRCTTQYGSCLFVLMRFCNKPSLTLFIIVRHCTQLPQLPQRPFALLLQVKHNFYFPHSFTHHLHRQMSAHKS